MKRLEAYHLELSVPGRAKEDFKVNVEKWFVNYAMKRRKKTN